MTQPDKTQQVSILSELNRVNDKLDLLEEYKRALKDIKRHLMKGRSKFMLNFMYRRVAEEVALNLGYKLNATGNYYQYLFKRTYEYECEIE